MTQSFQLGTLANMITANGSTNVVTVSNSLIIVSNTSTNNLTITSNTSTNNLTITSNTSTNNLTITSNTSTNNLSVSTKINVGTALGNWFYDI